jgi:biopolymer transport protein ExbB/TolQ
MLLWGASMLLLFGLPALLESAEVALEIALLDWGRSVFGDNISRAILLLAIYGLLVLMFKWRVTRRQERAFRIARELGAENPELGPGVLAQMREWVGLSQLGAYNELLAYGRLHAVCQAAEHGASVEGTLASLKQHADSDWDSLESSMASTQFLVWLLPTAGFLGTVFGMTEALNAFSTVVGSGSDLGFTAGLTKTAKGLGVAFHTTLVGLAAVIPLLAVATAVRRRSRTLLERIDKYFVRLAVGDRLLAPATAAAVAAPAATPVQDQAEPKPEVEPEVEPEPDPAVDGPVAEPEPDPVADDPVAEPEPDLVAEPEPEATEPHPLTDTPAPAFAESANPLPPPATPAAFAESATPSPPPPPVPELADAAAPRPLPPSAVPPLAAVAPDDTSEGTPEASDDTQPV